MVLSDRICTMNSDSDSEELLRCEVMLSESDAGEVMRWCDED